MPFGWGSRRLTGALDPGAGRHRTARRSPRSSRGQLPLRHLVGGAHAAELQGGPDDPLQLLRVDPGMTERHGPAVRGDGELGAGRDVSVFDERSALTGGAEAESLQLADDLERERIVELGDVDVGRRQARPSRRLSWPRGRPPCRRGRRRAGAGSPTPVRPCTPARTSHWLPRGSTAAPSDSAARSAATSTMPHPPSDVMAQSSR